MYILLVSHCGLNLDYVYKWYMQAMHICIYIISLKCGERTWGNEGDACEQLHNHSTFMSSPTALVLPLHVTKPLTICSNKSVCVAMYVRIL